MPSLDRWNQLWREFDVLQRKMSEKNAELVECKNALRAQGIAAVRVMPGDLPDEVENADS